MFQVLHHLLIMDNFFFDKGKFSLEKEVDLAQSTSNIYKYNLYPDSLATILVGLGLNLWGSQVLHSNQ